MTFERSVFLCMSYSVVMRDSDSGQFDDKTLFGNKSNLHTKIAFTHNISRWTHNLRPVLSLSAVQ